MQLSLGIDPRTEALERINALLIEHFGRVVRPDEKRRDPVWTLVQGVIGAQTKTVRSNRSADQLFERYGSWDKVTEASEEDLVGFLETATFPELMVERLKACLQAIVAERGTVDLDHLADMSTTEAMAWLESLPGVARKVSAGVMNASTFRRRALVIDSNHRRVIQRMALVPAKADTVRAYDVLMPIVPEHWSAVDIDEHHLLVKRVGQRFCRPKELHCASCPVRSECQTAIVGRSG